MEPPAAFQGSAPLAPYGYTPDGVVKAMNAVEDAIEGVAGEVGIQIAKEPPNEDGKRISVAKMDKIPRCPCISITFKDIRFSAKVPSGGFLGRIPILRSIEALWNPPKQKEILKGLSGQINPGDMVALMGTSGAGKSTLLNVLSRRNLAATGEVLFNNCNLNVKTVKTFACFILQEDLFYGFITVKQHIKAMAQLRTRLDKHDREELVEFLLKTYGLQKCQNSYIGNIKMGAKRGISGGEKKRLNIASELLTNPSVIFADEPTTGLDAVIAQTVMDAFSLLKKNGRTIVCTIHQPSTRIFEQFNKVMLLAEGRTLYFGDRQGVVPYFLRLNILCPPYTNVADFLVGVCFTAPEKDLAQDWEKYGQSFMDEWSQGGLRERYLKCIYGVSRGPGEANAVEPDSDGEGGGAKYELADLSVPGPPTFAASWAVQYWVLLRRCRQNNVRNPMLLKARLIQTFFTAIVMGFVYFRLEKDNYLSKTGASTFILNNQGILGLVSVLMTFSADKVIAVREYQSGVYGLFPYFFAKTSADAPFLVFNPVIFGTICWYMANLNPNAARWILGMAFVFLLTVTCASIGYLISSVASDQETAVATVPLILMPLLLVSGFMIILNSLPGFWIWLQWISPFRWAFSGMMHAVWRDVELDPCPPDVVPPQCYNSGNEVLTYYAIDKDHVWSNALILIFQFIVYRSLALIGLILVNIKN